MGDSNGHLAITDQRSGRNNVDPPTIISETHCVEAKNVDFFNATFARKRGGVTALATTNSPFTGQIVSSLFRHVPGTDVTAAELWGFDDAATSHVGRLAGGTAWATPTLKDAPTGNGWDVSAASLNGKFFVAMKTAQDRLHCYDPNASGGAQVRRTGLAVMGAPAITNSGSGTYAATTRYYRTRPTIQIAGITILRGEPSASTSFTPSGSAAAAVVTQGTLPGEGETHWEAEGSADNATFFRLATIVIGTPTYSDAALVSSYSNNPLSAAAGTYTVQKSYRFIAVDQGRLLGFGSYTSTDPQNRVEYSAVIGSSNIGDEERVPLNNFQDLIQNSSGVPTGLVGPVLGSFFPFTDSQVWKMTPSGNVGQPYNTINISTDVGAINDQCITVGQDETGNPAVYWMSKRGPYRYGLRGLEYLGKVIEDYTIGANGGVSINLAATNRVAHACWYNDKRQVAFWLATGAANDPNIVAVFNLGRVNVYYGGYSTEPGIPSAWTIWDTGIATTRCSVMFSNTIGASMSRDLKPYVGSSATTNTIGKCDTGTQDFGVSYQSFITTRGYQPWGDGFGGSIQGALLSGKAAAGVSIQVSTIGDFGARPARSDTASLAPAGSETRVQPRVGTSMTDSGMTTVQFTVGDSAPANNSWQLDSLSVTWKKEAPVVA